FTTLIQGEKRDRQINQLVGQNSKYGEWTYILTIEGSERGSDRFYLYHSLPFLNLSEITISWGKPHTMFEGGHERIATLEEQMAATLNFTPAALPVTIDHCPGIGTAFYANSKPNTLILVDHGPRRYQIHTANTNSFLDPTGAFYYLIKDFKFLESSNPEN
ncbi:MAG: hypothetical protein ABIE22_05230, partial [archaeon]